MRVFLVYDRRTGEPVSTVEEGKPAGITTGQFLAALPAGKRKQMAVVEVTGSHRAARKPRRRRKGPSHDS